MTFSQFSHTLLLPLEETRSKLEQTQLLADYWQRLDPSAPADHYTYLLLGQLGPTFRNPQFNFGRAFMLQALAQLVQGEGTNLFGEQESDPQALKNLKKRYGKLGDLGLLAQEVMEPLAIQSADLEVEDVFASLQNIAQTGGEGSQQEKISLVVQLLRQLQPLSARYVVRMIMGQLRLGFSDKTILDALSWFVAGDKSLRPQLDEVYQRHPDIGLMVQLVVRQGIDAVTHLDVQLGVPVIPALADRLKTSQEMIDKMGEVVVEPKYDGTRVQIHWSNQRQELHTFTRNLEENTAMFPELRRLLQDVSADEVILDAEAVGYDPATGELVPFQKTITRKRKHGIEAAAADVPLRFFVFDVLLVDGQSLLREPLRARRERLAQLFAGSQNVGSSADLVTSPYIITTDPDELRVFHISQLEQHYEGAMVKKADGPYEPGRKSHNWVKFKEREGTGAKLTDTIDAAVVGYYYGRGKRAAFGIGAFLVAVRDESQERLVTLAKIGTGLSDDQWREMKDRADAILENGKGSDWAVAVPEGLEPDVTLPAQLVVEVAADEITVSPMHTAGVALRFPRLVRFRDDKTVAEVTTLKELEKIKVA